MSARPFDEDDVGDGFLAIHDERLPVGAPSGAKDHVKTVGELHGEPGGAGLGVDEKDAVA